MRQTTTDRTRRFRIVGYAPTMQHRLRILVVALAAGCGSVRQEPALDRGCGLKAEMDEDAWPAAASPVANACDASNPGRVTGMTAAPTSDATRGKVGAFSGTACVDFPSASAVHGDTGLTMSAWVRPTALDGAASNGVISKRDDKGVNAEYSLFIWTGNNVWIDLGDSDRYQGTAQLQNGVWTQLTAVFDGTRPAEQRVQLFINGVADSLRHQTIGNLGTTLPSYASPVHVGCMPSPSQSVQQTFTGQLDDVTIWNRALTDDEITQLYVDG